MWFAGGGSVLSSFGAPSSEAKRARPKVGEVKSKIKQIESQADDGRPNGGKNNTKGPYRGKEIGRADLTASTPPLP